MMKSGGEIDISGSNIGVIEINGMITESLPVLEQIEDLKKNKQLKALVLRIDSPGGAVGASQEIYMEIRKLQDKYPVIASMGNLAASGGLYISLGAKTVYALPGTLTGSMGVLMTVTNFSRLLNKAYIDPITITSGKLKDAGNPTKTMDPQAKAFLQEMINKTFEQFQAAVKTERKINPEVFKKISDGRVVSGRQAVEWGIAHFEGTFADAVELARKEAGIEGEAKLAYLSRKPKGFVEKLLEGTSASLVSQLFPSWEGLLYSSEAALLFGGAAK